MTDEQVIRAQVTKAILDLAKAAKLQPGALLVIGIVMQVGLQVILNIAVVTDTIPNTGIGLPFFSAGGSALFLILCEMGVVLSVSRSCAIRRDAA